MTDSTTKQAATSQVGITARGMIDGSINYLLGAEKLLALRDELGIYSNDPDFVVFVAVQMELNNYRSNNLQSDELELRYDQENTKVKSQAMKESVAWAKQISLSQCESLAKRYGS